MLVFVILVSIFVLEFFLGYAVGRRKCRVPDYPAYDKYPVPAPLASAVDLGSLGRVFYLEAEGPPPMKVLGRNGGDIGYVSHHGNKGTVGIQLDANSHEARAIREGDAEQGDVLSLVFHRRGAR